MLVLPFSKVTLMSAYQENKKLLYVAHLCHQVVQNMNCRIMIALSNLSELKVLTSLKYIDCQLRGKYSYFSLDGILSFLGTAATQHIKCSSGKNGSGSKVREVYSLPPNGQSEEKRKRAQQSNSKSSPLEKRQRKEFPGKRERSPSGSSDQGSDSEGEGAAERRRHTDGGGVKCEGGTAKHGKAATPGGADMPPDGRAIIQQLKSGVSSAAPCIKTEHNAQATGGHWGHVKPPLHTPAGAQNGDGPALSMPDSAMTPPSGETPHRGLLAPPSPTLSPPMAGSPLPREERGLAGGRGPDFELLQRLAVGGAAGRVLFHPLALGPQGTQSLYAPSTIRYAPAELGPSHPAPEALPSDHSKPPAFFPHLQRIAALPPFSGFSSSESSFPPGLPFCINGLRGTAASEED